MDISGIFVVNQQHAMRSNHRQGTGSLVVGSGHRNAFAAAALRDPPRVKIAGSWKIVILL